MTIAVIVLLATAFGLLYHRAAKARSRAEASEKRFRTVVAHIPAAVYRRAPGGTWPMEFASARLAEIIGDAPAYGPLVPNRAALDEQVAASGEDGFTLEYEITHPDGGTRWIRDMGRAIRDADGAILWVDGTLSDITDVKQLATDLRLSQRLEAVGQLAAGLAHEINTPMQFVGDGIHFLAESFDEPRPAGRRVPRRCAPRRSRRRSTQADGGRAIEAAERSEPTSSYLRERVPAALDRTLEGVARVATIVAAMKDFGRPGQAQQGARRHQRRARIDAWSSPRASSSTSPTSTSTLGNLPPVMCNVGRAEPGLPEPRRQCRARDRRLREAGRDRHPHLATRTAP